jgi:hypothetical protein
VWNAERSPPPHACRAALAMTRRLMYVEDKSQAVDGRGRIGWVDTVATCRAYRYAGRAFQKQNSGSYNCFDAGTGELALIAEPRVSGRDKLNGGIVDIDDDAREEYWLRVRKQPHNVHLSFFLADPRVAR